MNDWMQRLNAVIGPHAGKLAAGMAPLFVVMMLAMMVLPLPPFILDLLFTFNIALALMVMMVAASMVKPLDFAALTAVLLINVAFGVITRAAPQLNIFAVGFPVTIMAGFLFILLSLPTTLDLLTEMFDAGLLQALDMFR